MPLCATRPPTRWSVQVLELRRHSCHRRTCGGVCWASHCRHAPSAEALPPLACSRHSPSGRRAASNSASSESSSGDQLACPTRDLDIRKRALCTYEIAHQRRPFWAFYDGRLRRPSYMLRRYDGRLNRPSYRLQCTRSLPTSQTASSSGAYEGRPRRPSRPLSHYDGRCGRPSYPYSSMTVGHSDHHAVFSMMVGRPDHHNESKNHP